MIERFKCVVQPSKKRMLTKGRAEMVPAEAKVANRTKPGLICMLMDYAKSENERTGPALRVVVALVGRRCTRHSEESRPDAEILIGLTPGSIDSFWY